MSEEGVPREGAPTAAAGSEPSEEELRAAYEAELNRITSSELMLQSVVSLLNLGGRRLGPPPGTAGGQEGQSAGVRDLEQVRDAIDGVRALLGVLERTLSKELGPLRDALAQLQLAYAREAQTTADTGAAPQRQPQGDSGPGAEQQPSSGPGPAEASGRLWVPGR